jgi:hypothetical protein
MDRATILRAGASLLATGVFVGSGDYVLHHPKNDAAPLQPPAVEEAALRPGATPPPAASGAASARASAAPTRGTQPPRITLQPGVRATELPRITYTHVS